MNLSTMLDDPLINELLESNTDSHALLGHVGDELMADVLRDLHTKQGGVKFLGSYPAAGDHAHTAREHADARWQDADDWVAHLRTQIRG